MPTNVLTVPGLGRLTAPGLLTPQTEAAGGYSDTTPTMAMAGFWKRIRFEPSVTMKEVSASDNPTRHNVWIDSGMDFTAVFILPNTFVVTSDFITQMFVAGTVYKYVVRLAGANKTITGYGRLSPGPIEVDDKAEITVELKFVMVDIGSANPVIS